MTPQERFVATVRFEKLDRPFRWETIGYWEETLKRWYEEGLSQEINDQVNFYFYNEFDLQIPIILGASEHAGFDPLFEEEILEEKDGYIIKRDFSGSLVKVLADGTSTPPYYLEYPVKDWESWEKARELLKPETPGRLEPFLPFIELASKNPWPLTMYVTGLFGILRHLFGFDQLMFAYYDQPELIHDISRHWVKLWKSVIAQVHEKRSVDMVNLWEDMCGKNGPMIGPKMFETFMSPYYLELVTFLREDLKIPVISVDTDGDPTLLIPKFIDAGINLLYPFEVQAGMDVVKIRKEWPNHFAILGGIDKRALAFGKEEIDTEIQRVVPKMLEYRGYFPAIDHAVPPDVSLENWNYFRERVRAVSE